MNQRNFISTSLELTTNLAYRSRQNPASDHIYDYPSFALTEGTQSNAETAEPLSTSYQLDECPAYNTIALSNSLPLENSENDGDSSEQNDI